MRFSLAADDRRLGSLARPARDRRTDTSDTASSTGAVSTVASTRGVKPVVTLELTVAVIEAASTVRSLRAANGDSWVS